MGHWSVKCAVSSLPIRRGDEVVMLLGANFKEHKGGDTGGYVWQGHFFNLLAPPIFGKYNEYGWVEECDQESLNYAWEALQLVWGALPPKGVVRPNPFDDALAVGTAVIVQRETDRANHKDLPVLPIGTTGKLVAKEEGQAYDVQRVQLEDGTIVLQPVDALDIMPRIPALYDIRGDIHWHDFETRMRDFAHENYDYTFIHKAVWNNLVNAARENFHGDFHMGYARDNDSDRVKARRKKVEDVVVKHGGRIGNYHPYAKTQQFFDAVLEMWGDRELVDHDMGDDSFSGTFTRSLAGWFEHAFTRKAYGRNKANVNYVNKLVNLAGADERRKNILLQAQLMFTALIKGGIVVRGHREMPSEQQDGGPYWPHLAVMDAMKTVMYKEACDQADWGDEPIPLDDQRVAIETLAKQGLNESYEFRD